MSMFSNVYFLFLLRIFLVKRISKRNIYLNYEISGVIFTTCCFQRNKFLE